MSDLILPLKGIYFDQVRDGTKPLEYRLHNAYWAQRLERRSYDRVILTRGYPKGGGIEGETRLTRQWRGFTVQPLEHEHFGSDPVIVYAIDVSTPLASKPGGEV